jgi:hypothetical protein
LPEIGNYDSPLLKAGAKIAPHSRRSAATGRRIVPQLNNNLSVIHTKNCCGVPQQFLL